MTLTRAERNAMAELAVEIQKETEREIAKAKKGAARGR